MCIRDSYKSERMNEIIPGVYVKEVVVFHGESLVYSIDGVVGTSVVVESDILKNETFHKDGSSSFELINSMLVSQETRNDHELIPVSYTHLDVYKRQTSVIAGGDDDTVSSYLDYTCLLYTSRCV